MNHRAFGGLVQILAHRAEILDRNTCEAIAELVALAEVDMFPIRRKKDGDRVGADLKLDRLRLVAARHQGENKKENAQGENPMKAMKAMMKKRRPEMLNDLGSMRSWQWEPREFAQYCNACAQHRVQVGIVLCGACGDTN